MADKTKYRRLFDLHKRFMFHGRITIKTMMDDYGINRRTANRDINDLISLGVQLENEVLENGLKVWFLPASQRKITIPFNLTDVAALFLGRGLFDFSRGTLLGDSLDKIYETIETQITREKDLIRLGNLKKKVYSVNDGPKELSDTNIEELDEVLTGLLDEKLIQFEYTSSTGRKSVLRAIPYTLVTYKMGLYLLARPTESDSDAIRIYAIERMNNTEAIRGTSYRLPTNYAPEQYFRDALFIQRGSPEKIELIFDAGSAPFVAIRRFHHSQEVNRLPDGRTQMTLHVPAGTTDFEIVNWIISFHEHVTVISPPHLKEAVRNKLAAALKQYDN
ncbi:MAG: WYL domain-containing transcriptional regulator [Deltaproteobacteria bacterium]|nr:WYL domain-containing transcriptional regulator [Deltaproteobacteria bacterium]MBN2670980.1 WYL domain-containing transcriptional regulator [Deltaproteobacteria bacterium]